MAALSMSMIFCKDLPIGAVHQSENDGSLEGVR